MILVELGPGHGTLMKDITRILFKTKTLSLIHSLYLIETSPKLQEIQKENLLGTHNVFFHKNIDLLPNEPAIFIANEFFDAFPIRQFHGGQELGVTIDGPPDVSDEEIFEDSPQSMNYFQKILDFLKKNKGIFIIIDYGNLAPKGNSLQSVRGHQYANPFQSPGESDLTAHVNFGRFQDTAQSQGFLTKYTTQREFLISLGIEIYAQKLMAQAPHIQTELHRLISPHEMGNLFKVLSIWN
jgi:NADH dehydrogenase [ubiquinone] 1 alpha subcomplex assembly factor 7